MINLTAANKCDQYPVYQGKTPGWYGIFESLCHCPILMYFGDSMLEFDSNLVKFGNEFLPEHTARSLKRTVDNLDVPISDTPFKTFVSNVSITRHAGILVYRVFPYPQEYSEELDVEECVHLSQHMLETIAETNTLKCKAAKELQARLAAKYYHIVREIKRLVYEKENK